MQINLIDQNFDYMYTAAVVQRVRALASNAEDWVFQAVIAVIRKNR